MGVFLDENEIIASVVNEEVVPFRKSGGKTPRPFLSVVTVEV